MHKGSKLKELRGQRSQSEIAACIGVSKSAWAMYERGERVPRDKIKVLIASFFNMSVEELFYPEVSNVTISYRKP